jgi:hypothetical protein
MLCVAGSAGLLQLIEVAHHLWLVSKATGPNAPILAIALLRFRCFYGQDLNFAVSGAWVGAPGGAGEQLDHRRG